MLLSLYRVKCIFFVKTRIVALIFLQRKRYCSDTSLCLRPDLAKALSDDARLTSLWRTEKLRKIKVGIEVAHAASDSDTTFKVKRSKVNLQGTEAYRGGLPHSLLVLVNSFSHPFNFFARYDVNMMPFKHIYKHVCSKFSTTVLFICTLRSWNSTVKLLHRETLHSAEFVAFEQPRHLPSWVRHGRPCRST